MLMLPCLSCWKAAIGRKEGASDDVGEATGYRNRLSDTVRCNHDLGKRATDAFAPRIEFSFIDRRHRRNIGAAFRQAFLGFSKTVPFRSCTNTWTR